MLCPRCERTNAEGARFCDGCGASLRVDDPTPVAATGPTTRLPEPEAPAPIPAAPLPRAGNTLARHPARQWRELNGGLWLIGLGVLFFTGTFWPGILVLVGISAYLEQMGRGQRSSALRTLIVPIGLAVLFWTGTFWPGVLILLGIAALVSPEFRSRRRVG